MWTRRWIALPSAALMLMLLGGAEGIDKGELECEEAVQHLVHCCPDNAVARNVACYKGRVCDSTQPDLTPSQSVCLRDQSCDDLYFSGACENPKRSCLP